MSDSKVKELEDRVEELSRQVEKLAQLLQRKANQDDVDKKIRELRDDVRLKRL